MPNTIVPTNRFPVEGGAVWPPEDDLPAKPDCNHRCPNHCPDAYDRKPATTRLPDDGPPMPWEGGDELYG